MTDAQQVRIRGILGKLAIVRSRGLSCFGSNHHKFEVAPPLSEEDLRRFEAAHGVELPSCYRSFLRYAGSSGAGPHYGLYGLDRWDDFAHWVLEDMPADFLRQSCPLRPGPNTMSEAEHERAAPSPYQGTLSIGSQGCTYATQLIVTGAYRGRVVYVDADGYRTYVVRDRDFLAWYERWLDELLTGCDMLQFGYGPAGDETALFAILADAGADEILKAEAAHALCRLPHLSDAWKREILSYLKHSLPDVRKAACASVRKFGIDAGAERATSLLGDPVPAVRLEAVTTLMQLTPDRHAELIKRVMHAEQDNDVASAAFRRLNDAGKLSKQELLHIITASDSQRMKLLAVTYLDWSAEDEPLAIGLLNNLDARIRCRAVIALNKLESTAAVPELVGALDREQDLHVIDALLKALAKIADARSSDILLRWAASEDDFHRLDALAGLSRIGDERVAELALGMLREHRQPKRVSVGSILSHGSTIAQLAQKTLRDSPSRVLLRLE